MFRDFSSSVNQVYIYEVLQRFVINLIGLFIPIHIASSGFPISSVFMYLGINIGVFALISLPVSYLIARIGFKHSLILSYAFYLPALLSLRVFEVSTGLIVFAAVSYGIGQALHWISLHAEFATDTEGSRDKESGRLVGLPKISQVIAPVLGGVIMASMGFHVLVTVAMAFLLASAVPLLLSRDHRDPMEYSFRSLIDKEHRKFGSLFVLRGTDVASGALLFPLFVYYIVGGEINAGGVKSLAGIGSIVFALTIGRVSGKIEKAKLIAIGVMLTSVAYIVRGFIQNSWQAFGISFAAGLFFMIYYVPIYSIYANVAEDEDLLEFYAFREFLLNIGKLLSIVLCFGMIHFFGIRKGFIGVFLFTAFTTAIVSRYARWLEKDEIEHEEKRE
jgi:YQGE family putative transporter